MYNKLSLGQKINVIEEARKTAKFTNNRASFIIFEQLMKNAPIKEHASKWVEFLCGELNEINDLINGNLNDVISDVQRVELHSAIQKLNDNTQWCNQTDTKKSDIIDWKENFKGKQPTVNHILIPKKNESEVEQKIIMEKRNGSTITLYLN